MKTKFICPECGGTNVEIKYWVNPNTKELKDSATYDSDHQYCNDCQNHYRLIEETIETSNELELAKKIEDAKQVLKEAGYFTDNLWCIVDVKESYDCTDEEAYKILNVASLRF